MDNNPKRRLSGFTLVELLVAMAIIGVLIALAIFGIAAAQRNSRDTARRASLDDINVAIADLYSKYAAAPAQICFDGTGQKAYVRSTVGIGACAAGEQCIAVPLKGSSQPSVAAITCLSGAGGSLVTNTDQTKTQYCFKVAADGYALGAQLESQVGSAPAVMQNLGTSQIAVTGVCP